MNARSFAETVEELIGLEGQHLLIDADDTLWENNIYFNRAIDAFIDFLDHSSMPADRVRLALQEIELENLTLHGYGSAVFGRSLQDCYSKLSERHVSEEDIETILGFAQEIMLQEIDLLPGVEETLPILASRHELVIFTKGSDEEQRQKITKSGIDMHFLDAIVVPEKDETVYREIITGRNWQQQKTWMVGNSPKSDINPALAAGINAVFIPQHSTWALELQELNAGPGRFLQLTAFAELLDHF